MDTLKSAMWLEFLLLLKALIYTPYPMGNVNRLGFRKENLEGEGEALTQTTGGESSFHRQTEEVSRMGARSFLEAAASYVKNISALIESQSGIQRSEFNTCFSETGKLEVQRGIQNQM